jgi:hypothetical protein
MRRFNWVFLGIIVYFVIAFFVASYWTIQCIS